jgi:hypothetical protein
VHAAPQPVVTATTVATGVPATAGAASYPAYGSSQYVPPAAVTSHAGTSQSPNRYALITFGIVALYLLLAVTTRIVFIGVLPVLMSIRSKSANEPLAPFAIGAAVLSIIVAFAVLSHH